MGNQSSVNFQHQTPSKRALLFGFDYSGNNTLNGPVNDIQLARNTLINTYSFPEDTIYMYSDGNLPSLLRSFISSSIDGDINVIHYSGHGDYVNGTNVLVGEDMKFFTSSQMTEIFRMSKGRFLIVIDACDSGYLVKLPSTFDGQMNTIITDGVNNFISQIINFSGSGRIQLSYESRQDNGITYGNFSYAFYNYIGKNPNSLWINVYDTLNAELQNQDPVMSSNDMQLFYYKCNQYI